MAVTQDYRNFKQLLEYFVAHLEYCNAIDFGDSSEILSNFKSSIKYIKFKDIFEDNFKIRGIGVNNNYTKQGDDYSLTFEGIKLEINVDTQSNHPNTERKKYKSNGNIIRHGFCNIRPESWNGESIATLEAVEVAEGTNIKERINTPVSIQDLGLFDEQEPNKNLVNFYTTYFNYIKKKENMNNSTSNSDNNFAEEVKNLLQQTKNLILTGAPGTGKTYLAKQIADELTGWDKNAKNNIGKTNPCVTMVQFHPSYDYTDFVEGLRPIDNGNAEIGFERKDGTFKEFCREAYKNYVESKNITVKLEDYNKIEALLQEFRDYIIATIAKEEEFPIEAFRDTMSIVEIRKNRNNKWIYFVKTNRGGIHEQGMSKMVDNYINYKYYQFTNNSTLTMNEASVIFDSVLSTYAFGFLKAFDTFVIDNNKENIVKDIINNINYDKKVKLKNYVFIIDEINRGEISKIFGELFYAIDPGYRGEVGRINTQYQNLSDSEDDFSKGFYVPENVYIIGTMNDIDRSVDSFDFAMRRRFAWKEITPTDTQDSMLSTLDADKQEEAKKRMNSLNKAISEMPELGTQYQLGASYFLKLEHYDYDFEKLWHYHIKGLLYEYLRGVPGADSKLADLKKAYEPENEQ